MGGVLRVYYRGDSRVCGIAILDNISCGIWNADFYWKFCSQPSTVFRSSFVLETGWNWNSNSMKILESVTRVLIVISVSFSRNVTHRGVVSGRYRVLSSRRYIIPKSNHHLTFGTVDEFSWFFLEYLINFSTLSLKGRGNISVIVK